MTKPLTSFFVLLLSIGFAFFYVKPAYDLVQERKSDIAELDSTLEKSTKITELVDKITQNLQKVDQASLDRFAAFLPEAIDPIRFANNLQHIGLINGIIIEDIKVDTALGKAQGPTAASGGAVRGLVNTLSLENQLQKAEGATSSGTAQGGVSKNNYRATKASFVFVTTYEKFRDFLDSLEKNLGLINVTALTFAPVQSSGGAQKAKAPTASQYQYAITVESYSLK